MKKYIYLTLILFFLINLNSVGAVSGTCSYHGGVDCSAGSDWDGSAICSDGWRDSSEIYSSVFICKKTLMTPCTSEENAALKIKYGTKEEELALQQIYKEIMEISSSQIVKHDPTSLLGVQERKKLLDDTERTLELSSQSNILTNKINYKREQIENECNILGAKRLQEEQRDFYKEINNDIYNDNCHSQYGYYSFYDTGYKKCFCNEGYTFINGKCDNPEEMCHEKIGINSRASKSYISSLNSYQYDCVCDNGYIQNNFGICDPTPKDVVTISNKAKEWAENRYFTATCESATTLTMEEKTECNNYRLNKDRYNWEIYDLPIGDNTKTMQETIATTTEIKAIIQELKQQKIEITTPKKIIINKQTSTTLISATSSNKVAMATTTKMEAKKTKQVRETLTKHFLNFLKNIFNF